MNTTLRVFAYLKRYPFLGGLQLACAVGMTFLVLVYPSIIKEFTGEVIPKNQVDRVWPLAGIAAVAFFATNLFNALRIVLNNTFEQRVIFDLRSDLYERIQRLPTTWFDNRRTGDVMTRVTEDVTSVERVLIDGIEQGVVSILQIVVVGAYLFFLNWQLALVAMIPIPLLLAGALAYTLTAAERHRRVRRATSAMNSLLHDNIDGMGQIKAYAREEMQHQRFNAASNKVRLATLHVMRVWAVYNPGMEFLRNMGAVLVLGFGAWWTSDGTIDASTLLAFLFAVGLFYEPITRLHQLNQIIQQGRAAGERVFAILDSAEEIHSTDGAVLPEPIRGHIVFDRVSFAYPEAKSIDAVPVDDEEERKVFPVLQEVCLEAKAGQTIALVGHTGAGKSTIINLLCRFYEYDEGAIFIDGMPVHTLNKQCLRRAIGYVTQESFLFNGTVRENLELAIDDPSDEEMWSALRASNAEDFVRALPEQLDTNVGERGVKLSVGEKQRISIARAILKNPPILLLDEATASVDNQTERLIQEALDRLMKERTSVVIAHRLSTVRNADKIYVLRDGCVREQGTHEELCALGGEYASLVFAAE